MNSPVAASRSDTGSAIMLLKKSVDSVKVMATRMTSLELARLVLKKLRQIEDMEEYDADS